MIPELGHLALILALGMAKAQNGEKKPFLALDWPN